MKLALGTVQFGLTYGRTNISGQPSVQTSHQILEICAQNNVQWLDTAHAYGCSEEVIGLYLKNKKNTFNIITKIPSAPANKDAFEFACRCIKESATRLTQFPDVILFHNWQDTQKISTKKILSEFNKEKFILGASVQNHKEALEALNDPYIKFIQLPHNILDWRWRSPSFLKKVQSRADVHFQVRSALLQGLLASLNPKQFPKIPGLDVDSLIKKILYVKENLGLQSSTELCYTYLISIAWIETIAVGMENLEQATTNIDIFKKIRPRPEVVKIIEDTFVDIPEELLNPANWS